MKSIISRLRDLDPIWFIRESWSFMQGSRWGFWTGLPGAYARYICHTLR